jgi:hypothetical protein
VGNGGPTDQLVFADPRSATLAQLPLVAHYASGDSVPLPFTGANPPVSFLVPPDTRALTASTQAQTSGGQPLVGAAFDLLFGSGDPDVGSSVSDAASGISTATVGVSPSLPQIAPGRWLSTPSLDGPFTTAATVPSGTATASLVADTPGFDTSVTTSTGDYWLSSINSGASATGLSLAPGASGQIGVLFSPSAATPVGSVISGTIYIDHHFNDSQSGDQLAAVPYSYTVGTAPATTPPAATTSTSPAPGPTVTPPSPAPRLRVITTGIHLRAKNLRIGVAALRLPLSATCASGARGRCPVSVTATVPGALAGSRGRTVTIGSGSLAVAVGRSAFVHLRLTTRGLTLLRARHALTITLHVRIRTPGSRAFAHTVRLHLTYARAKHSAGA